MSLRGLGCVKTRLSQGRAELFSHCFLPREVAGAIGFDQDEIETEILRASSTSEFSHSRINNGHAEVAAVCRLVPTADIAPPYTSRSASCREGSAPVEAFGPGYAPFNQEASQIQRQKRASQWCAGDLHQPLNG